MTAGESIWIVFVLYEICGCLLTNNCVPHRPYKLCCPICHLLSSIEITAIENIVFEIFLETMKAIISSWTASKHL